MKTINGAPQKRQICPVADPEEPKEDFDFIINYHIKYRMGQEGAEDSEE